jgi:hypothetical protein
VILRDQFIELWTHLGASLGVDLAKPLRQGQLKVCYDALSSYDYPLVEKAFFEIANSPDQVRWPTKGQMIKAVQSQAARESGVRSRVLGNENPDCPDCEGCGRVSRTETHDNHKVRVEYACRCNAGDQYAITHGRVHT